MTYSFIMLELKKRLSIILSVIKNKEDVVFLEYPTYKNIGDVLIYHGSEKFFSENKVRIKLRRTIRDYDKVELDKVMTKDTTIILQGGGNFGDLYSKIQKFREQVVIDYPNTRIVILPQTIHFEDENVYKKSSLIFKRHADVHIFCRDSKSLTQFSDFSDKIYLCPDMAHFLYGILPISKEVKAARLNFIRTDTEINNIDQDSVNIENAIDWDDLITPLDETIRKFAVFFVCVGKLTKLRLLKNIGWHLWYKYSWIMIKRFSLYFTSYEEVLTSRLHGHIFSCLLNVKNIVLDNSYGKNSMYFLQWTKGGNASFVKSSVHFIR